MKSKERIPVKPSSSATGDGQKTLVRQLLTGRNLTWVIAIAVVIAAVKCTTWISVEEDPGHHFFSAEEYAAEFYDSKVDDYIETNAVDLATVLNAIETDEEQAKLDYGHSSNIHNAYSYPVTFTAVAGEAMEKYLNLTVEELSSDYQIRLQTFAGTETSLRDVSGTVDLNQFLNQVEYLQVSLEFNFIVEREVLIPFLDANPADSLEGKTLKIVGAFTDNNPGIIKVMPISLEIEGDGQ